MKKRKWWPRKNLDPAKPKQWPMHKLGYEKRVPQKPTGDKDGL